jgi:tetratricopeptide (TPR) repeat protein
MFDVFISYGHQDQAWVRTLAENLYRAGQEVFYDEWEIDPGDVLVHRLDEGIRTSRNGILVVSPASLSRPWVAEEYAAMLTRTVAGQQRLIPVLLGEAELPPFLAARVWVDFRHADGPEYDRRVSQLVAALRGERPPRPGHDELRAPPPGSGFRPEGTRHATLRLGVEEVTFTSDDDTVSHRPRRLDAGAAQRLWELTQAQHHPDVPLRTVPTAAPGSGDAVLQQRSLTAGVALTEAFLSGPAGEALTKAVIAAVQVGGSLALALDVQDDLATLPWETLRLPGPPELGPPLVLHPHVKLYRAVSGLGPTPAMAIAGPLRILVAIASPEADSQRGELLDYEAELNRLLDAVDSPRREERTYVRLLNQGTVRALRDALALQRFHVLHLSCHARPGLLMLEDDEGRADLVDAARFAAEVLTPDRGVPLLVLSGCSTALPELSGGAGEAALPGLARELVAQGVPAVLAMTAPVTDPYATRLTAALYHTLSTAEQSDPLTALSDARRSLEQERMHSTDQRLSALAEWATPTLFMRGSALPLYDWQAPFDVLTLPSEPQFGPRMVVRQIGDFVGRRAESRRARHAVREQGGLVMHGLGGVGKSTLAAQTVATLGEEAGLVVALSGSTSTDAILTEVGKRLLGLCLHRHLPDSHPLRELSHWLQEPKLARSDRLALLTQEFTTAEPLLLLLDNFEDNLVSADSHFQVADTELGTFLATWVQTPGRARLLMTSRYPFVLAEQAERHLVFQHLGPLSWAETRKLFWRLPGLDALSPADQQRAYLNVGGHPRTLEYLDALLRGGQARFADVAIRMERAMAARGLTPSTVWQQGKPGLDAALAEAITLAVDDVVLGQLLGHLEAVPLARHLLVGASVYRLPVDGVGLGWQVGDEQPLPAHPDRDARLARLGFAQQAALAEGRPTGLETLGLPSAELTQLRQDLAELAKPPLRIPLGFEQAKAVLLDFGLLAPVSGSEDPSYLVHRWTAQALASQEPAEALADAHRRAARYWRWRVRNWPQSQQDDLERLLEARYHHHAAGELDEALAVTERACDQLRTWGAYSWAERLCRETLAWIPDHSHWAAVFTHQLGILAHRQGDYPEARRQYQRALEIDEALGDQAGMADSYHRLGILAQDQGDYPEARRQYQRALEIDEALGNQAGMATSYGQLGILAYRQGDYQEARRQYQRALEINEALGNRAGMADSYHQLGILAQDQGDYQEARRQYQRALEIDEALGNQAGMANSYNQLGNLTYLQGDYQEAQRQYQRSLEIDEALGDQAGMATSYHNLGNLAYLQGDYQEARRQYQRSLEIKEALGNQAGMATSYHQLGMLAQDRGDYPEAQRQYLRSLEIKEALGNQAGMATSYGQLGSLLTEIGKVEEAAGYTLASLGFYLQVGAPEASLCLNWLARQQEQLGETQFRTVVHRHLGEQETENLLQLLKEQEGEQ